MIYGCGVDIEEIDRFIKHLDLKETPPSLISDVFTEKEISINKEFQKMLRFPLGFSCKESLFKAFGKSWTNSPISWKDIELIFHGDKPEDYSIELSGYAIELFKTLGLNQIDSFIEYTNTYVMFQVVLLKKNQ
jgi:phosphopantetheine--protein transferase-like protein